ncbi:MAG: hypothetical protein DRN14_06410 [Thermoplasmata archaeon]|nr:MAG: hypothetical protein DRN14_06410 [Thermoplasmata archaeon]
MRTQGWCLVFIPTTREKGTKWRTTQTLMWAEEIIMKHEESKETGEVSRTMDGSKTTGAVENGRE